MCITASVSLGEKGRMNAILSGTNLPVGCCDCCWA
jgi:hypothetical protein